ncbi:17560_t:CDS:2 [Dentiscutata erythropus]|uniref:17560_t:CDS:1 n=1 Tax=Dentiscutata erythropus TaxID=1348616 RepID=A0A9N9BA52_9GLOM|nr:17560_t:CDS:2 [Dentiscutata erythropus]
MSSTTPSTSSSNDYKCSANHVPNTWSEDMVTSDLRAETSISQLLENSPLLYTPTLSSTVTSPDLRDTLEADDDENRIPPTGIFTLQDLINIEELRKLAAGNDCMFSRTTNNSTTLPNLAPSITPMKPIAPALFSPISAISSSTSEADPSEQRQSSTNNVTTDEKKKSAGGRKRKAESLEEKEQRQRERILRNRHAAQMSRDKKRRQMADLESQNTILKEENAHLSKRLKVVEEENANLSAKLDSISAQLAEIQSHLAVSEMNKVLLDGVRGSAVSAASEKDTLDFSNIKEDNNAAARQDEEPLRDVVDNPYLSDLDVSSSNAEATIADLLDSFLDYDWSAEEFSAIQQQSNEKRWSKSVKAVRGCGASGLKRAPRDWRKYPP